MRTKAIFPLAIAGILSFSCETAAPKADSLKEAYADSFKMGCAINPFMVSGRNPQAQELLEKHGLENKYDADTVGGWAGEMLEKVPEVGDSFRLENHEFTVTEMDGFRVTRMQVTDLPPETEDKEEQAPE